MTVVNWLFNPSGLTAHGFCLSWAPGLIALHVLSDAAIGLAYFSIPLALGALVKQRPDLRFGWVINLFAAFIIACGLTHFMSILTLWVPAYGVEGIIKLITAIVSVATAVVLWPLLPRLVAQPSSAQLQALNIRLEATLAMEHQTADRLRRSEAEVRAANLELEHRVEARTAELTLANARLEAALAEREIAQTTQARTEREFRASFEAAAVGKLQAHPETGQVIRCNRAFASMVGYDATELVGQDMWMFTHPDDYSADQLEYDRLIAGEIDAYVREKRYVRKDGSTVWGRVSATVVRTIGANDPYLIVAVVEDIDERYKSALELMETKKQLEVLVEQRTSAIGQRDLLLREVYHRVKNNLQIVDGLLYMQSRALSDPAAKAALKSLRGRVYALGLVHHQLMGSLDLKTFDVAPYLQELSSNVIEGGARDDISVVVDATPLDVDLDLAIPLGLIVTELVTNSLKHAFPNGHGRIDVGLQRLDGQLVLVVRDDGCGTPKDMPQPGARRGLGTDIVKGLVSQLGGKMTVSSGGGTRSEIIVPEKVS